MSSASTIRTLALLVLASAPAFAQPNAVAVTLDSYLHRDRSVCRLGDRSLEVEIEASLPKLKKQGSMHGVKIVSRSGQVAYRFLRFTGDKLVKTDVIARFLTAESQPGEEAGRIAVTAENYQFRFRRTEEYRAGTAYVYQLRPRKKRVGLFKGELWLDAATGAPVRESGELVKSPSIFVKGIKFQRDYLAADDTQTFCTEPQHTFITVQTRIAGEAEMVVRQHPVADGWQPAEF